jgi:5'-nucleotidase/UDP-sugar diphosphatase
MNNRSSKFSKETGQYGGLCVVEVDPNPAGNIDRLFVLKHCAETGPVSEVQQASLIPDVLGQGRLRIFHFNDLHNHLTELSGPAKGTRKFSQMVKRVRAAKADTQGQDAVLFLSIGDDHTGSVLDELMGWRAEQFVLDASYRAYSAAGVDASVLGNHEFDRGSALLAKGIRQDAKFPILSANVHSSGHLRTGGDYVPAAIAIVGPLRIGMIGLTTHIETRVGQPGDPTLAVASPVAAVKQVLPALAPLVDIVLILSHCGYGDGAHKSGKAAAMRDIGEADFSIARTAAAITKKPLLILGAHTHTKLNEQGLERDNIFDGIPIFQAESNGEYLGEIEALINRESAPGIEITKACLHPIKHRRDPTKSAALPSENCERPDDYDQLFELQTVKPILDQVELALNRQLATVSTYRLTYESAVLSRYAGESSLANFVCDAIFERMKTLGFDVDFAVLNGATIQSGVERGPLTTGDWFDVLPYADEIFLVRMTGRQIDEMLQSNAKRVLRPDEIATTDYFGFLPRGFFHTSGHLRYQLDLGSSAAAARATDIRLLREPVDITSDREFTVVMSTYLALGGFGERWNGQPIGGGVPGEPAGYDLRRMPSENTGHVFRDELAAYITDLKTLSDANVSGPDGRLKITDKNNVEPAYGTA